MRTLNGVNTFNNFKAYIKDQSYYHLDYKRDERLLTLIMYDVIQHEVEDVMDLSGYPIINSVSHAVYHESDNIWVPPETILLREQPLLKNGLK